MPTYIKCVYIFFLEAILLFVDFSKAFDSIHRGKMNQIFLAYGLPKETYYYDDANKTAGKETRRQLYKNAESITPQDTNYTATCLPSRKLFKLDEPDM